MQAGWRGTELRLLLPLVLLVPLGFALAHIVAVGKPDPGPLGLAIAYIGLVVAAHVALVLLGHRGDQLLLPLAATIGGVGLVMLNRLPQTLAGMNLFGFSVGMAETQLAVTVDGPRTTISLDDRLVKELMAVTGAKSRTEAIHRAIAELIRREKLEELKALSGKIRITDNWQALEAAELKAQAARERRARGRR